MIIKRIIRGCTDLPHCGPHPGTIWLIFFIFVGAMAGLNAGIWGMIGGASIMAILIVPFYLYGAYSRAKHEEANHD